MLYIAGVIVSGVLCLFAGMLIGGKYIGHKYSTQIIETTKLANKHLDLIGVYDFWMSLPQDAVADYLERKHIHTIAIYGYSFLGNRLYQQLKQSKTAVVYAMDQNPKLTIPNLVIKKPGKASDSPDVDAVIVTAIGAFDSIKENLEHEGYKNIISLYAMLYEIVEDRQKDNIVG